MNERVTERIKERMNDGMKLQVIIAYDCSQNLSSPLIAVNIIHWFSH